eukprot:3175617-Amphidinium_carterae.1
MNIEGIKAKRNLMLTSGGTEAGNAEKARRGVGEKVGRKGQPRIIGTVTEEEDCHHRRGRHM